MTISLKGIGILAFLFILAAVLSGTAYATENCSAECAGKVCVTYFYKPDCSHCQATEPFIDEINKTYAENITLHKLNIKEPANFALYNSFCSIQNLSVNDRGIPLIEPKTAFSWAAIK